MLLFLSFILSVAGFVAFLTVFSWLWYVPLVMRVFGEPPFLRASIMEPLDDGEECQFTTADGLTLRGTYLRTPVAKRQGVIIFCHEYKGDRWGALPYVDGLRGRGFDIFTFDFRNHGSSDRLPDYQPLPWLTRYELADTQAAVNYACSRGDAHTTGVGLMGVSKGANAALCVAAHDARVRAVVADGAFPVGPMQRHYIRRFMNIYLHWPHLVEKLPDACLVSYCEWAKFLLGLRRRCRFVNVEQLVRKVGQPVFMIHGKDDGYIPLSVARDLRRRLSGRSKMWVVPSAKHNGAIFCATQDYHQRVNRFFQRHLGGGRKHVPHPHRLAGGSERSALASAAVHDRAAFSFEDADPRPLQGLG